MPRSSLVSTVNVIMSAMVLRAVVWSVHSTKSFAFLNAYHRGVGSVDSSRRSVSTIANRYIVQNSSLKLNVVASKLEEEGITDRRSDGILSKSRIIADNDVYEKIKASLDKRKYRLIELSDNKLQILLVSDSETDTEAAAVHVKAGHFDDPADRAGLAHFHEHMVFLGRYVCSIVFLTSANSFYLIIH